MRYPARRFIPYTYHFFIANLIGFYLVMRLGAAKEGSTLDVWTGRAFFVWASVFNLFVVSVFWSVMADVFRSDQAKRLFGFIGVGGTLGSIVGSSITAVLAARVGTLNLLLVSAALLEIAVLLIVRFPADAGASRSGERGALDKAPMGGSMWAAFTSIVRSPYLIGIAVFLVLYVVASTLLYFEQTDIVGRTFADRASRTAVLAKVEIAAQSLTVLTQLFFTGRIIRWCGLAMTLALQPLLTIIGFGTLAMIPTFTVLSVFIVLRRASNFSLTNPAMETLFTVVPREDKYKAKSFIETAVYRGGDQVGVWTIAGLTAIGFGLAQVALAAVPMAAAWMVLGLWLGRRQAVLAGEQGQVQRMLNVTSEL